MIINSELHDATISPDKTPVTWTLLVWKIDLLCRKSTGKLPDRKLQDIRHWANRNRKAREAASHCLIPNTLAWVQFSLQQFAPSLLVGLGSRHVRSLVDTVQAAPIVPIHRQIRHSHNNSERGKYSTVACPTATSIHLPGSHLPLLSSCLWRLPGSVIIATFLSSSFSFLLFFPGFSAYDRKDWKKQHRAQQLPGLGVTSRPFSTTSLRLSLLGLRLTRYYICLTPEVIITITILVLNPNNPAPIHSIDSPLLRFYLSDPHLPTPVTLLFYTTRRATSILEVKSPVILRD
ncbi:hypothetical protein TMatcc_003873 [Talaromyces marneffei ATCC 18224]